MGKQFVGIYYRDADNKVMLCEVDGGICYEAYTNASEAQKVAAASNADAVKYGWSGRYEVNSIPAGTLVFDREIEAQAVAA